MKRFVIFLMSLHGCLLAAESPNILMIAVDDLRPMLGCYGDARAKSPNIDQLAERGLLFERAYCQYAKCGTSRLSLMTGLRPDSVGVFSNSERDVKAFRKRALALQSMGQWFKNQGYHTRSFGKIYHDGWDNPDDWSEPSRPGRDREMWEVTDENEPSLPTQIAERLSCPVMQSPDVADSHLFAGRMTDEVIALLEETSESPQFTAVGFRRPHLPFIAPKRYFDLYQPDESWLTKTPEPPKNVFPIAWFNSDGYIGSARKVGLTMPNPPNYEQAKAWNGYEMRSYLGVPNHGEISAELQLQLLHAYAACISYVDAQIGRLMETLVETGRDDNTIVVLWSDHGWHLGEHSAWGKMSNYEIATRVPLIFAGPGIVKGRSSAFAELVDLYPSLCALAGIALPAHLEGDDLSPVLKGEKESVKARALSQYSRYNGKYVGRVVRTDTYRYVDWRTKKGTRVAEEYYDVAADPNETINRFADLSDAEKEVVRKSLPR